MYPSLTVCFFKDPLLVNDLPQLSQSCFFKVPYIWIKMFPQNIYQMRGNKCSNTIWNYLLLWWILFLEQIKINQDFFCFLDHFFTRFKNFILSNLFIIFCFICGLLLQQILFSICFIQWYDLLKNKPPNCQSHSHKCDIY